MIFLSSVYRSKFPPTNNQVQTSANLRTQTTIQNGQVTVQNVQGRQSQGYAGNARNNQGLEARVINTVKNARANQPRVVRCYNYNGEDHVDAYDSDCDYEATTNAIFMASLSHVGSLNDDMVEPCYDSDMLSEVPHYDTYHDSDMLNSNVQELGYIENIVSKNESYDEIMSKNNVISYTNYMLTIGNDEDNYVPPHVQKNDKMLSVIKQMKYEVAKCNMVKQESTKEAYLCRELYTASFDRNIKVYEYEKQVFSQQTEMKNLKNDIAFLKKNFKTLKKESSKKYEKNISEIVDLEKAKKELENIVFKTVPVAKGSSETTTKGYMENYKNVSQDIRNQLDAEDGAKAIERLKQGESINVQNLKTNLYWEFRKSTSRDGESLESYYSRFVTLVKQSQELKSVSNHKLYDILKQHQNKVNEIRATSIAHYNTIMEAGGKDHPPMLAPVAKGSSETTTKRYMENYKNVSQDIRNQLDAEAGAVQIILTWIDNDIYFTLDACLNACEMWKAIERLKQGE
nr:hypothetical protein [Tanacetum cinerariifolium]